MLYEILHTMEFDFTEPVLFGPMTLRLHPRTDAAQIARHHRVAVSPIPEHLFGIISPEGSPEEILWFAGRQQKLRIDAHSRVETFRTNPFDFLLEDPRYCTLPFSYGPVLEKALAHCLFPPERTGPLLGAFTDRMFEMSGHGTLPFLTSLTREIHETLTYAVREEGPPHDPEHTLAQGGGSCRDFATLAMAACRIMGIAARYTSGYHTVSGHPEETTLHAWIEAYLPGAGWVGLDPSEGLATADRHIALISSPTPSLTLPSEGHFLGLGQSTLTTRITIEPGPSPDPPETD